MASKSVLKSDKFRKARGGHSRLFVITCEKCTAIICKYQKDGPGILKRMYIDRINEPLVSVVKKELICPSCKEILGTRIVYKKEKRDAYRLFVGAVTKKITKT